MPQRKPRVLVVSDSRTVREACRRALERVARPRARPFLEGFQRLGRAEVVVVDLSGRSSTGVAFVDYLKMEYPDLPLVVLSRDGPPLRLPCGPRTAWLSLPIRDRLIRGLVGALWPGAPTGKRQPTPQPQLRPA